MLGAASGDCVNGFGRRDLGRGAMYEGEWRGGKKHGWGNMYRADGSLEATGFWTRGELDLAETARARALGYGPPPGFDLGVVAGAGAGVRPLSARRRASSRLK